GNSTGIEEKGTAMQGVRYNLIHVRTGIFYRELRGTQVMNPRFNAAALYNARGRYASLEHLLAPPPAGFGADPIRVGEPILISGDRHAIVNQLLINGNRPFKADDSHYWREALVVRCSSKRLQVRASGKTLAFVLIAGSKYVDHLQSDGQVGWSLTEERWRNP